ncbi:hypothetical protein [Marinimicrobium sp. UBA4509]|jgi:Flp pilus assembly protein TadD|uniref:hypothetical protein n=1 Tax=Marinimicrobium sp. UBA4509 TaxID=1946811 RepID=UPI00257DF0BD|nr:hypothetical protein [Marinimicrobium sp. UBA4509]
MRIPWAPAAFVLLLGACSHMEPLPEWVQAPSSRDLEQVLSGELLFDEPPADNELPPYDLMTLSPMMRVVAEEVALQYRHPDQRAEALHRALLSSPMAGGLGMRYTALNTTTAARAFERREVNCLSFTLMYVAMARHIGLNAEVNDVQVPPVWDFRDGESFLLFRHVNAKVMLPRGEELVIDLEMERYSPVYEQKVIGDRVVAAQFYNNLGMERVAAGDRRQGFLHLRRALQLDDRQSYLWNNLGTLYKRMGVNGAAEVAYRQGLTLAPGDLSLMSNLASLYEAEGETDKAAYFLERVRKHRNSNPYYLYSLAREQLANGDLAQAERYLEQAIARQAEEPRFYALAAEIYDQRALPEKAELMRRKAESRREEVYL